MKNIYGMILSHNCGSLIEVAYKKIPKKYFHKIFITDDGSNVESMKIINGLNLEITKTKYSGYGSNVKNGLEFAFNNGADYVVEIHGDGAQFDPIAIIPALKFINRDYDFIIGSRFINIKRTKQLKMPFPRLVANLFLSFIDKLILKLPFTEFHTGFRIYGKKFKNVNMKNFSNDYLFSFEIIAKAAYDNFKCAEVPIECDYISEHTSHSYLGATIYALLHFKTLYDYLVTKYTRFKVGIFKD
jgi:hypothetical protein